MRAADLKMSHTLVVIKHDTEAPKDACSCGRRPPFQTQLDHLIEAAFEAGREAARSLSRATLRSEILQEMYQ